MTERYAVVERPSTPSNKFRINEVEVLGRIPLFSNKGRHFIKIAVVIHADGNDVLTLDIRRWQSNPDGTESASTKGIAVPIQHVPALYTALTAYINNNPAPITNHTNNTESEEDK
jgi:hypothetical protein